MCPALLGKWFSMFQRNTRNHMHSHAPWCSVTSQKPSCGKHQISEEYKAAVHYESWQQQHEISILSITTNCNKVKCKNSPSAGVPQQNWEAEIWFHTFLMSMLGWSWVITFTPQLLLLIELVKYNQWRMHGGTRTHFDTMTQQLLPHLLLQGSLSSYVTFEIGYAQRANVRNHLLQITIMTGRKHKKHSLQNVQQWQNNPVY